MFFFGKLLLLVSISKNGEMQRKPEKATGHLIYENLQSGHHTHKPRASQNVCGVAGIKQ